MPDLAFARRVREICDAEDAALVLDDVRAGLRLSLPWHNMFLSVAHTESDIEQALAGTEKAFQALG